MTVFAKTLILFSFLPLVSLVCYCLSFVMYPFWDGSCWMLGACEAPNKEIYLGPGLVIIHLSVICCLSRIEFPILSIPFQSQKMVGITPSSFPLAVLQTQHGECFNRHKCLGRMHFLGCGSYKIGKHSK